MVKAEIKSAIEKFINNDKKDLVAVGIYEPSVSHRIAVYLENEFPKYKVDCEYNKDGESSKLNSEGKKVRPDIIVHKRGISNNLVVIEVKYAGRNSKKAKSDIKKFASTAS